MKTLSTLWQWATVGLTGRAARRVYQAAAEQVSERARRLESESDPSIRAALLHGMSAHLSDQGGVFRTAFGRQWLDDDAMDMVDALSHASEVYRLLGDVESAIANPRRPDVDPTSDLGWAVCDILDLMTEQRVLAERMALLPHLYRRLRPLVGGWAADAIPRLGWPGGRSQMS
jgi:hypothetical protein